MLIRFDIFQQFFLTPRPLVDGNKTLNYWFLVGFLIHTYNTFYFLKLLGAVIMLMMMGAGDNDDDDSEGDDNAAADDGDNNDDDNEGS